VAEQDTQDARFEFSLGANHVDVEVDESLYPLEALYGACYLFIDRCFVYLSRPRPHVVDVRLTARGPAAAAELEALAGEFANELLSQVLRQRLSLATGRIREFYTAAALRAASSAPSVDELLAELESEELLEDPLEIMVPWEEKHGAGQGETEPKKDPDGSDG
jgi:His-Xaa-Ser system protein HxsD